MRTEWLWTLIPVGFVAFWCLIAWLIARLGGWRRLARRFRAAEKPREGQFFYLNYGSVGPLGYYKGCLIVGVTAPGLYLAVWPIFRPGHPPLLIPWQAIVRADTERIFWSDALVLTVNPGEGESTQPVTLYGADILAAVRARLPFPPPLPVVR